ncbi:MAG: N-acetylmuramoyl-L-alanine amidase-like domain-containing protein [Longimicrobiales bacterium]
MKWLAYRGVLGPVAVILIAVAAMLWSPLEPHRPPLEEETSGVPAPRWADEDWAVFEGKVRWAVGEGLDSVPLPSAIAAIGRSFVGTAYLPQTLEVDGPEGLVINFRGLDCVTFVENSIALARFVKLGGGALLARRVDAEIAYARLLAELRYRGGVLDGYASRLHYFSEWISDNAEKGMLVDMSQQLGGVRDVEPIDFMSTHPDAYRQLADPAVLSAVRAHEAELTSRGRTFIPEARIAEVADQIRDGDVIAATSTVAGLDIAHTGLALWVDGSLRLLHAPLVGDSVEISTVTLAERIVSIAGQDGIIVARPLEPSP